MHLSPALSGLSPSHSPYTQSLFARNISLPPPIDTRDASSFSHTPIVQVPSFAAENEELPDELDLVVLSICENNDSQVKPDHQARPSHPVGRAPKGSPQSYSHPFGRDFTASPTSESSPQSSPSYPAQDYLEGSPSDSSTASSPLISPFSLSSSPGDRRIQVTPRKGNRPGRREALPELSPMPDSPSLSPFSQSLSFSSLPTQKIRIFDFKPRIHKISLDRQMALSRCARPWKEKLPKLAQVIEAIFIKEDPYETRIFQGSKFLTPQDIGALFLTCRYFWQRRGALLRQRPDFARKAVEKACAAFENIPLTIRGITAFTAIQIRELHFQNVAISTIQIQELSVRCRNLSELVLTNCAIQSESLSFIKNLPYLTCLDLSQNRNIRDGLFNLVDLINLKFLSLAGCRKIKDRHLQFLEGLTKLEVLKLSGNKITHVGLLSYLTRLKHLRELFIENCPRIETTGFLDLFLSKVPANCRVQVREI